VYKYEQGKNRISAGRLYEFGKVLGVPITFFFEGIVDAPTSAAALPSGGHTDELGRREAIELFAVAISNPKVRLRLRELARALGSEPDGSTATQAPSKSRRPSRRVRIDRGRDTGKALNRHPSSRSGYRHSDEDIGSGPEQHRADPQHDPLDHLHRCAPRRIRNRSRG